MTGAPPPPGWDHWFTVFTPAYNRAQFMRRICDSLERQSFRDFEWLIVDDGSGPQVREAVEPLIARASFPIRYIWQENQGLHGATNTATRAARGYLFTSCDDDDWYHEEGLARCFARWMSIPEAERERFAGVAGLCADPDGAIIGARFPVPVLDSDSFEIRTRFGITGDKCGINRTSILREHPFPTDLGRQVPLSLVWNRIAERYKMRFFDEVVQIKDFQPEGGTAQIHVTRAKSPKANALLHLETLRMGRPLSLSKKLRHAVNYVRYALHDGRSLSEQAAEAPNRWLWTIALPIGVFLAWRDRRAIAHRTLSNQAKEDRAEHDAEADGAPRDDDAEQAAKGRGGAREDVAT